MYPDKSWVQEVSPEELKEACVGMEEEVEALLDVSHYLIRVLESQIAPLTNGLLYRWRRWGRSAYFLWSDGGNRTWPITVLIATGLGIGRTVWRDYEQVGYPYAW